MKSGFLVVFHRQTPQVTPQVTPQAGLTGLEAQIVKEILKNPRISRKEIAKELKISSDTVKEYLRKLKDKNVLVRKGKTSGGYWEVV